MGYKKEKEAEIFVVRSTSSYRVKVEKAVSSSFASPRSCPFSSNSSSSYSSLSSSSSSFASSSFSTSRDQQSSIPSQTASNTASSSSFQGASKYNPYHSNPTSSRSLPDTNTNTNTHSHSHSHSHSHTASPTPTPTPTPSPTVNIVNIPSLALIKCIQSCLSSSKSNNSPSNRTLVKSTLLNWNLDNNNCYFENKKQNLTYNNVQIYPIIADKNVIILEDEVIDLCSDSPTKSRASHTNRLSISNNSSSSNSNSNSDSDRNRNGKGNEDGYKVDCRPSVFLDLSSSSSSFPSSSSSSFPSSSSAYPPPSRINPFDIFSLQQSENILFLVACNKSSTCLDVDIILATANYNNTCPFARKKYRNNHQNIQVPPPSIPAPAPIAISIPSPHPTTASSSFMAPLNVKKKPCDEYSVMFRLPPHSNRLVGIFISVPLGQSMSPLNSDYLNAVTAEEQRQGQGQWQGQRQDGLEGGRSSHIRILSMHCTDTDRTANSRRTDPGKPSVSEHVRDTVTINDSNHNTSTHRGSAVTSIGGTDSAAATGAGAENCVRNCRITNTFSSCPDHFKPFYLRRL